MAYRVLVEDLRPGDRIVNETGSLSPISVRLLVPGERIVPESLCPPLVRIDGDRAVDAEGNAYVFETRSVVVVR